MSVDPVGWPVRLASPGYAPGLRRGMALSGPVRLLYASAQISFLPTVLGPPYRLACNRAFYFAIGALAC